MAKKNGNIKFPALKEVSQEAWDSLAQKNIFFGHRSVGRNIMEGARDILKENPNIKLNIIDTNDPKYDRPAFANSNVGRNREPNSKCDAFKDIMMNGVGEKADIVFMKFCFIDIMEDSDSQAILDYYKKTVTEIQTKYPKLKIVHVTVPLTTSPKDFMSGLKRSFNLHIEADEQNIKRNEFNKLLQEEYKDKQTVFDLAKVESTYPDGQREVLEKEGKDYYTLVPDYTYDGGHLNELGRKKVAEQLLIFLAQLN